MTDDLSLAATFPPASREDWLKLVRAALKERPLERLTTRTYDGIPVEPLYERAAKPTQRFAPPAPRATGLVPDAHGRSGRAAAALTSAAASS